MRVVLAIIPLLAGCSELDPEFAISQWFDGVEENRPTAQGLHTATNAPGEWATTSERAREGSTSWHFGQGGSWPTLCDASLLTPDFEASRVGFLRFAYYSDLPSLSEETATDGATIEVQVEGEPWRRLETHGGYPYLLDPFTIGSPHALREGILAGDDGEWHDDYVVLDDTEPGQTLRFRFRFGCDVDPVNNSGEGLYLDDVEYLILE